MIVDPRKLNQGSQGYVYSEKAEQALMDFVFNGGTITEGYNPDYDAIAPNGAKIEIKFTNRADIFIEQSYYDGTPSGLSITKADFYLVVQTGLWQGNKIGKIKLIRVEDLHDVATFCNKKVYQPGPGTPGSRGFVIKQELGKRDGWLGNIAFNDEDSRYPYGFSLNYWTYQTPLGKKIAQVQK